MCGLFCPLPALKLPRREIRTAGMSGTLAERTEIFERDTLLAQIRKHNFHMTNVARAMGLTPAWWQQLGIDLQEIRKPA